MVDKVYRSREKRVQPAQVKLRECRGGAIPAECDRFSLLAQTVPQSGNLFVNDLATSRRQPPWKITSHRQTEYPAHHYERVQPRQGSFEPAGGRVKPDVEEENGCSRQAQVNVKLKPRFGTAQRQER